MGQSLGGTTLSSKQEGTITLWPQGDKCKPGEERCPMGHCQKPRVVNLQTALKMPCLRYSIDGALVDDGAPCTVASGNFEQHVCSVCGVVYVPISAPSAP